MASSLRTCVTALAALAFCMLSGGAAAESGPVATAVAAAQGWSPDQRGMLEATSVVERALVDALDTRERVRVVVLFDLPGAPASSRFAVASDAAGDAAIRAAERAILRELAPGEFELIWQLPRLGVVTGRATREGLLHLMQRPGVRRIGLDPPVVPQLAESVPLTRMDTVHALGFTGEGVTVAVLDSGIDRDHPDLADDLVGEECFCSSYGGCCPNGTRRQSGPGSAEDDSGHGTSAAGMITSRGVVAPLGAAPDAGILAIRLVPAAFELDAAASDLLAAANWLLLNRPDVRIANMSLATTELYATPCDDLDAITGVASLLIGALRERGVTIFAAAGNRGGSAALPLPACLSGIVAVGAVYDANVGTFDFDDRAGFHCMDPTTQADQVTCFSNTDPKIALVAPGASICYPLIGGGVNCGGGGTSHSTPLAAACAALLAQKSPSVTPLSVEAALRSSPSRVVDPKNGLSFPRLDCAAALAALPVCDDGEDNDGDGLTDFPADPGCSSALAPAEDPACDDGADNDLDGGIDFAGLDLDGDGDFTDPGESPPDPQCRSAGTSSERARRCGLGYELALLVLPIGWLARRLRR